MICQHCGKVLDNDKLVYCIVCGYPLKTSRGFFARSEETGTSRAEELAAPQPESPPEVIQPATVQPVTVQPVTPQPMAAQPMAVQPMQPMAAQPMVAQPMTTQPMTAQPMMTQPMAAQPITAQPMVTQPMTAQPMVQSVQQPGVMPQYPMGLQPMMQQPAQPMMMPQQPVMPVMQPEHPEGAQMMMGYPMQQMQYGMPQFAGYDPAGNPIYVQMVPQIMGYDPYGNPLYTMVAVHCQVPPMQNLVTPQVPVMQPMPQVMVLPPVMDVAAVPVQDYAMPQEQVLPQTAVPVQQSAPPAQQVVAPPVQQTAPPSVQPVQPVQEEPLASEQTVREEQLEITSAEDIPVSADALIDGPEENASGEAEQIPDEDALLNSIFSDAPRGYTMASDAKPGTAVFSINVSASEITSVRDEEAPPPAEKPAKTTRKKAEPKTTKEEKKPAAPKKKEAAPKKPQPKIISPDEFFDDKPKTAKGTLTVPSDIEKMDDEQLVQKLAAMEQQATGKKSHRTMKAASEEEMDLTNAVQDISGTKPALPN